METITLIIVVLTAAGLVTREVTCKAYEIFAKTQGCVNWWEKK
jgi:hypothetical protein